MDKTTYIYYSGATDITGKELQTKLDIDGGNTPPKDAKAIVIGWGTKTKDPVALKGTVLNHPDKIRDNRNKLNTLIRLKAAKASVADFENSGTTLEAIKQGKILLPLVGRTNFHQGGKGFWLCLTVHQVQQAIEQGAQYFQNYIDIKDEYRIHVFNGEMIYTQKKVPRDNMTEAFVAQHEKKITASAEKNNQKLDADTMKFVLGKVAKEDATPDNIIRSNTRGWKFIHITKNVNKDLEQTAVAALKAVGLDFGAVDCCIDTAGKVWIIEINSGPGLDGTAFEAYITAFKKKFAEITAANEKAKAPAATAKKIPTKTDDKKAMDDLVKKVNKATTNKTDLKAKVALMADMVDSADEEEAHVLANVFKKMFGA